MKRCKSRWIISVSLPAGRWDMPIFVMRMGAIFFDPRPSGTLTGPRTWRPYVPLQRRRNSPTDEDPGQIFASASAVWILDVTKDADFPRAQLAANDIGVKGGFAFPIVVGGVVAGVMEFLLGGGRSTEATVVGYYGGDRYAAWGVSLSGPGRIRR